MHYDVLDEKRRALLPRLAEFRSDFYLAGGTALALQIGHRRSVDFDFFTPNPFDPARLYESVRNATKTDTAIVQQEVNTLTVVLDADVRASFFTYQYPLLEPLIEEEYLHLASLRDIGCMKLAAVVSRASIKDYVDLYFILQLIPLPDLLESSGRKTPSLDRNVVLKGLIFFDDVAEDPIDFLPGHEVSYSTVKDFLIAEVKRLPLGIRQ